MNNIKKYWKRLCGFVILALLASYVANHGFVTIEVPDGEDAYTYSLTKQAGDNLQPLKAGSASVTKFVSRANYEITVQRGDKSYFSVIKTKGFFGKTSVIAQLKQEKSRMFVGNDPGQCMFYLNTLYSYDCENGNLNSLTVHVPSTADTPTFTEQAAPVGTPGVIEGIIPGSQGVTVVLRDIKNDFSNTVENQHIAYSIADGLAVAEASPLDDINGSQNYAVISFGDGFVAYTPSFNDVLHYSTPTTRPTRLDLKSKGSSLHPYKLVAGFSGVAAAYSSSADDGGQLQDLEGNGRGIKNQVVVSRRGESKRFNFDGGQYRDVAICGDNRLCLLSSKTMLVYDIAGNKAKLLYKLTGVEAFSSVAGNFLAVRHSEVLAFNTEARSGYSLYRMGDYQYCGSQSQGTKLLLCVINNRSQRVTLLVDVAAINTGSIDQKINVLLKNSYVDNVTAYGDFLYVSQALGSPDYHSSPTGYSPVVVRYADKQINAAIDTAKIDRNKYKISFAIN